MLLFRRLLLLGASRKSATGSSTSTPSASSTAMAGGPSSQWQQKQYHQLRFQSGGGVAGGLAAATSQQRPADIRLIDPTQARYLDEPCILVDEEDTPLESISKLDAHRSPLLHRAFSVFLFNTAGELLLQKRSASKITFPLVWTNTCCSHPHYTDAELEQTAALAENIDAGSPGIKRAVQRKLRHELGIEALPEQMHVLGRFIYYARSDKEWCEYELDYAVVVPRFEGKVALNPEEVADARYVDHAALDHILHHPDDYRLSPWFALFARFEWLDLWWRNLDTLERLKSSADARRIHRLN